MSFVANLKICSFLPQNLLTGCPVIVYSIAEGLYYMPDGELLTRKQRLLLNLDIISIINDALAVLEYDHDGKQLDLEAIHGSLTLEIVKGRFHRIIPAPSYLLNDQKKRQRTA